MASYGKSFCASLISFLPQTALHPDKFAGAEDASQTALAESWSSLVNDSYNRLRRPLDRAQYLLELSGQPLAEGEIQGRS